MGGQPFTVMWDIRLGHALSKNHVRIAYRRYVPGSPTSLTQFEAGVLFNQEDSDEDRAAERSPVGTTLVTTRMHSQMVTIGNEATPGPAELQWVWASERDGAGGYYISCADIMIMAADSGGTTPTFPVASPTPASSPTISTAGGFKCWQGTDKNKLQENCVAPLNTRCMTTWVNSKYYYRCSNIAYCESARNSAQTEGMLGGVVSAKEALTSLECCDKELCNTKQIVELPAAWSSSWKPIATIGFVFGLAHLLL